MKIYLNYIYFRMDFVYTLVRFRQAFLSFTVFSTVFRACLISIRIWIYLSYCNQCIDVYMHIETASLN
ncbi:hypothetical protein HUJ05_007870 [Dendroctonus ponderosae]|nr:hypothetical protein HUJ05_007870 [Dendroctonus ponderosae]